MSDSVKHASAEHSLAYTGLTANTPMEEIKIDKVFQVIGSCMNSHTEDLRSATKIILAAGPDAKVAPGVVDMIIPGSGLIKQHAEVAPLHHLTG